MLNEDQINPNFEKIIPLCIKELEIKFPDYGNSWMKEGNGYWEQRIDNEVQEYMNSMSTASEKRKLLNIINMCAMAWENLNREG
ncbi:hypothetical protein LCGC14_1503570 [marine sediment metagenome]|uniref:Uncharacterized protein n=1 Tax=marine sediment metagenome TaxID=412755 RepID=A0A0F9J3E7_9ZZZZ